MICLRVSLMSKLEELTVLVWTNLKFRAISWFGLWCFYSVEVSARWLPLPRECRLRWILGATLQPIVVPDDLRIKSLNKRKLGYPNFCPHVSIVLDPYPKFPFKFLSHLESQIEIKIWWGSFILGEYWVSLPFRKGSGISCNRILSKACSFFIIALFSILSLYLI